MLSVLYAIAGLSVRTSVCHMDGSVQNGWSWDYEIFTLR